MTGADLIASSLKTLGTLAAGETPSPDEQADALLRLNDLIDGWATQRLTIYFQLRTTKTLTASTASYTIGSGGAINIVRPTVIENVGLIVDTTATTPTEIRLGPPFTLDQWAGISQKTLTAAQPQGIFYDYGWTAGLGIIYPWPIPSVSTTQLVLYTPAALTSMALATTYTFPPAYRRLLRFALARELAPEFGGWDGAKEALYQDAMGDVKRSNFRLSDLALDPAILPTGRGLYNILTGGYGS